VARCALCQCAQFPRKFHSFLPSSLPSLPPTVPAYTPIHSSCTVLHSDTFLSSLRRTVQNTRHRAQGLQDTVGVRVCCDRSSQCDPQGTTIATHSSNVVAVVGREVVAVFVTTTTTTTTTVSVYHLGFCSSNRIVGPTSPPNFNGGPECGVQQPTGRRRDLPSLPGFIIITHHLPLDVPPTFARSPLREDPRVVLPVCEKCGVFRRRGRKKYIYIYTHICCLLLHVV
jgi:hypothetical protein